MKERSFALCGACSNEVHPAGCGHSLKDARGVDQLVLDLEMVLGEVPEPRAEMTEEMKQLAAKLNLAVKVRTLDELEATVLACRREAVKGTTSATMIQKPALNEWESDVAVSVCAIWPGLVHSIHAEHGRMKITFLHPRSGEENVNAGCLFAQIRNSWLDEFEPCTADELRQLGAEGNRVLRRIVGILLQKGLV